MSTRTFNSTQEYARHLQDIARAGDAPNRAIWMRRVAGEVIRDFIKASFLAGKDPAGNEWKSNAAVTDGSGKFAASYKVRPSGDAVTPDKIRLTDTGELRGAYKILAATADMVEVGPEGQRNINIATRAETDWGNSIAGFGPDGGFRERFFMIEVNKAWEHMMNGVPLSRIRKPRLRAM